MTKCGTRSMGWEPVLSALSGPYTDHTSLPTGNNTSGNGKAFTNMKIVILLLKN